VLLHRSGLWRDIAVFVSLSSADEFSCKAVLRLGLGFALGSVVPLGGMGSGCAVMGP